MIEVLAATHKVLDIALTAKATETPSAPLVHVRQLDPRDLVEDAFRATSRDGAANVEVMMRIQKELGALIAIADSSWDEALKALAVDSLRRAELCLELEEDLREVRLMHRRALSSNGISKDAGQG